MLAWRWISEASRASTSRPPGSPNIAIHGPSRSRVKSVTELARLTLASAVEWANMTSVNETKMLLPSMRISENRALPWVMRGTGRVEKESTAIGV